MQWNHSKWSPFMTWHFKESRYCCNERAEPSSSSSSENGLIYSPSAHIVHEVRGEEERRIGGSGGIRSQALSSIKAFFFPLSISHAAHTHEDCSSKKALFPFTLTSSTRMDWLFTISPPHFIELFSTSIRLYYTFSSKLLECTKKSLARRGEDTGISHLQFFFLCFGRRRVYTI